MKGQFGLVAVPRRYVKDWMLSLWNTAFGQTLGTRQPFRWIMFRELSWREQQEWQEKQ